LKTELATLKVTKVAGGEPAKLANKVVRKSIAIALTLFMREIWNVLEMTVLIKSIKL
jgi:ribosomal protein L29